MVFAVVLAVRSFTPEEAALWEESAQYAYRSFRDKAAESRNMPIEDMQVCEWEPQQGEPN